MCTSTGLDICALLRPHINCLNARRRNILKQLSYIYIKIMKAIIILASIILAVSCTKQESCYEQTTIDSLFFINTLNSVAEDTNVFVERDVICGEEMPHFGYYLTDTVEVGVNHIVFKKTFIIFKEL